MIRKAGSEPIVPQTEIQGSEPSQKEVSTGSAGPQETEHRSRRADRAEQKSNLGLSGEMNRSALDRQMLNNRADAIFNASKGLGTDEQGIFRSLSGLNDAQRKELDQIYQEKYGKTLEQQVREEMSGADLDKALSLLRGKEGTLDFRADEIHRASQGIGTDKDAFFRNLSGLSGAQRQELDQIYQTKFGMTLEQQIRSEMSGADLDKALGLLHGKGSHHQDPVHRTDGKGSTPSEVNKLNTQPSGNAQLLKVGSNGADVEQLQRQINEFRAKNGLPQIAVDGKFGPETERAIKQFQQSAGIGVDGIVGPATLARLKA
jgi:hypothetical protein